MNSLVAVIRTMPNNRFERSRGSCFDQAKERVDDLDKSVSFVVGATPRRSASSLGDTRVASYADHFLPDVLDLKSGRKAAAFSVIASLVIAFLFVLDAALNLANYRNIWALGYFIAFLLVAYGTWRMSRFAAIAAFLLYFSMSRSNCMPIMFGLHFVFYVAFVTGIRATLLFRRLPGRGGNERNYSA
jgi:hypothetical protein